MPISASLVPSALSALRSLVLLKRKIGDARVASSLDEPMPFVLPPVPQNPIRNAGDRQRMEAAFSSEPSFRIALDERGLSSLFQRYLNDDMPQARRRELFFQFLALFYSVEDAENTEDLLTKQDAAHGLDRYLMTSARLGQGPSGIAILRGTAETLIDFLGETAPAFLAKSPHQEVLSAIIREFAEGTDVETDSLGRIVRSLVSSVAVTASDPDTPISKKPLAVLFFSSLGKVRRDMGDEFAAQIVTHDGFTAVVSDWMSRVAGDPYLVDLVARFRDVDATGYDPSDPTTLPAELQPVYGALAETLKVVGSRIGPGDTLSDSEAFGDIFGAVLTGLSENSDRLLRQGLADDRVIGHVLSATLTHLANSGLAQSNDLVAPVFEAMLNVLGRTLPEIGQDEAIGKIDTLIEDLARRVAAPAFQTAINDISEHRGRAFVKLLITDLVGIIGARADFLADDTDGKLNAALTTYLRSVPDLYASGLGRDAILGLFEDIVRNVYPEDAPEGGFANEVLPIALGLLDGKVGERLSPDDAERVLRAYIKQFHGNRPIWQDIFERDLLADVIQSLRSGSEAATPPDRLPGAVVTEMLEVALAAAGRRSIFIADLSVEAEHPKEFLRGVLSEATEKAFAAAYGRLGRGLDAGALPLAAENAMDFLLSAVDRQTVTDDMLVAFLDAQITLFEGGSV